MRVLFVISGLGLGGAERQVVMLSKELVRLGHEVSVYVLKARTTRLDELAGTGIEVVIDRKVQQFDLGVLRRLRRHIRAWGPDIVHGFLHDGNLYTRLACCGTRTAVLNAERNDNYSVALVQRIKYRLTSALCDGLVANTYAGADFARRLHGLRREQVDVVWNGIDLAEVDARLAGAPRPAHEIFPGAELKRLCLVATMKPQKDHRLALRVLRRLLDADPLWRLICVGDEVGIAGYKEALLAERERLRLEPFVAFVGYRRDVPEIVASSDLLLVSSLHEGFPNAVLEAMACGTAVVSTDYSDVRRILSAEQVVGSRDEGELAAALVRCHARRAELACAQRRWVEQHATASASAAALLAVYAKYRAPLAVAPAL